MQDRYKLSSYENGIKMIANSPIESTTLHDAHTIDVHQYNNPWQTFNNMSLPENGHEPFETNHPEFVHLN